MPATFAAQLIASAARMQPTAADRIVLARCQIKTALGCLTGPELEPARRRGDAGRRAARKADTETTDG